MYIKFNNIFNSVELVIDAFLFVFRVPNYYTDRRGILTNTPPPLHPVHVAIFYRNIDIIDLQKQGGQKKRWIDWKFGFTWEREFKQGLKSKQKVVKIFLVFDVLLKKDCRNEDFRGNTKVKINTLFLKIS